MCDNNLPDCNGCIRDILKVILVLQNNVSQESKHLETCDRKVLGPCCPVLKCNTRPVTLFTCCSNGQTPWSMPISNCPNETRNSSIFRIEKIDNNCATFRVLIPCPKEAKTEYIATDSFFTMNLGCVCAIKCLEDTFVECI